jgi:hypothetical protein
MKVRAPVLSSAAVLAAVAAMTFSAASLATPKTTQPTRYLLVVVAINDQGIKIGFYSGTRTHDGYVAVPSQVPRGDYLSFQIFNKGKKLHNFTVFGKKTKPIKPGGKAHLNSAAMVRGNFTYGSTLDKGKAFHGSLNVV